MTTELMDGVVVSLVISIGCAMLCPVICWILPNRTAPVESEAV
jgi:hypothetical protein